MIENLGRFEPLRLMIGELTGNWHAVKRAPDSRPFVVDCYRSGDRNGWRTEYVILGEGAYKEFARSVDPNDHSHWSYMVYDGLYALLVSDEARTNQETLSSQRVPGYPQLTRVYVRPRADPDVVLRAIKGALRIYT